MTDFPDSGQLDLFEHSRAVALANDVIDALRWIAVARYRAEGLNACRAQLMRLALLAPQRVPALLAEIDEPLLNRDWRAFQADCHWLDSEDDTAGSWYPAWQLVEHPGMEIEIGELATLPASRAGQTFVEIRRLLSLETCGYSAALVSSRSSPRRMECEFSSSATPPFVRSPRASSVSGCSLVYQVVDFLYEVRPVHHRRDAKSVGVGRYYTRHLRRSMTRDFRCDSARSGRPEKCMIWTCPVAERVYHRRRPCHLRACFLSPG